MDMGSTHKYHVVKVSSSGLGDAIKAVLLGALYSELSGRVLIVDWRGSRYSNGDENTFHELFELHNIASQATIPTNLDCFPETWSGRLHLSLHEVYEQDTWQQWDRSAVIKAYSADLGNIDSDKPITISWDFDQAGKLLRYYPAFSTANELLHHAATKFLRVTGSVADCVRAYLDRLPEKYLAAHLRNTKEFQINKRMVNVELLIDLIRKQMQSDEESFFLATDNADTERIVRERFTNVVTIKKWFAPHGKALHLDSGSEDKLEIAKAALTDILLLANSQILICTPGSSFSECARLLSTNPNQQVIDVSALKASKSFYHRIKSKAGAALRVFTN